jgi:glutamate dehydrogenase
VLAEEVSARINQITDEVAASQLVDDPAMRRAALRLMAPDMLVEKVGGAAKVIERLPPAYQRALVATAVASNFVYRFGLGAGFEEYRRYVAELALGPASGPLSGTTPS